ncbi:hypothetical protein [Calothrix sp. PCC 6303]|nr:hypothetical protein [Calothrix sp. PCC 6303]
MPRSDASRIEQNIETDVTAKIQLELLRSNLQIQDLTDQRFQEVADIFYTGLKAVESVLRPRYATRNGFLTPQDQKDAELAARQAIKKRNRDKRNVVMSSTTITIITGAAVRSGTQRVRENNSNQININPRSRYPVNRLPTAVFEQPHHKMIREFITGLVLIFLPLVRLITICRKIRLRNLG